MFTAATQKVNRNLKPSKMQKKSSKFENFHDQC